MDFLVAGQIGPKQNRPQVKSAPSQIGPGQIGPKSNRPKSNRPQSNWPQIISAQVKSATDQIIVLLCFLFNLIICIVNCVVYLI